MGARSDGVVTCGECGAGYEPGPASCPLCGGSPRPARGRARPPRGDVDRYQSDLRRLREQLRRLRDDEQAV
ncbi:MAG TPA: hypothetical protein VHJ34_06105 [Actinomycetota bacterium]|nr:hypothetical protein [Actinomycetota bacterium]